MPHFVQIGHRIINLELVCGAERARHHLTIYFAVPNAEGDPMSWTFDDPKQIEELGQYLTASPKVTLSSPPTAPATPSPE